MPIYEITDQSIVSLKRVSFSEQGIRERNDLQQLLKNQIEIISPDTLIVSEEFSGWEGSRVRIDLLGLDKNANLVVIELKRTEDGGYNELQALRYASMISEMTFTNLVQIFKDYSQKNGLDIDPEKEMLGFLEWEEVDEEQFAQEVRIILASAEFSKELTTSVMWLNNFDLNIRCVRMHPYSDGQRTLLDVQTVIPLPEVEDYQIKIKEKKRKERESRTNNRDFTKYSLTICGKEFVTLNKRNLMFNILSVAIQAEIPVKNLQEILHWRKNRLFRVFEGTLSQEEVEARISKEHSTDNVRRHYTADNDLCFQDGCTIAINNQWGEEVERAATAIRDSFPELGLDFTAESSV